MVRGQKEICGKHLYSHFYTEGHSGIKDFSVQIIDLTDVNNPDGEIRMLIIRMEIRIILDGEIKYILPMCFNVREEN